MTRAIRNETEHRVLKAYAAGKDLHAIATSLDVPHGRVSLLVQDVAQFNRAFARTLVADWERPTALPPPLRRAPAATVSAPTAPAAMPPPPPEPPAAEPEPVIEPDPDPGWSGWLCEPYGRRYRDAGPHGAPKRCGCRLTPITVGSAA